jgi:2-keto-3-deoxy-galactonokinase
MTTLLIGLDWGTTSCRAYLMRPDGAVLETRSGGEGIMTSEVYAVRRQHSILGRLMGGEAEDEASFAAGLARLTAAGEVEPPRRLTPRDQRGSSAARRLAITADRSAFCLGQ